jgi:tail tube protein
MSKVFNIPIVKLNGVDYRTKPGATLKLGGMKAEPRYASGKLTGFAEEPEASEFDGAFEIMSDTDIEAIRNFHGQAEYLTDVGITYASNTAQITETPELTPGDGIKFKIMGEAAVKAS